MQHACGSRVWWLHQVVRPLPCVGAVSTAHSLPLLLPTSYAAYLNPSTTTDLVVQLESCSGSVQAFLCHDASKCDDVFRPTAASHEYSVASNSWANFGATTGAWFISVIGAGANTTTNMFEINIAHSSSVVELKTGAVSATASGDTIDVSWSAPTADVALTSGAMTYNVYAIPTASVSKFSTASPCGIALAAFSAGVTDSVGYASTSVRPLLFWFVSPPPSLLSHGVRVGATAGYVVHDHGPASVHCLHGQRRGQLRPQLCPGLQCRGQTEGRVRRCGGDHRKGNSYPPHSLRWRPQPRCYRRHHLPGAYAVRLVVHAGWWVGGCGLPRVSHPACRGTGAGVRRWYRLRGVLEEVPHTIVG